ncbi:CPBP family intramembrane metalloprotease [Aestuariibacter halophilus]|uniref:CPBP family intramembrane metalloprotease n=2 Tax=Fluctibacter halophilus TaxID=226011 RepID=A0ABS8GDH5_9ALTE|nr:CPBP family intramembrane metalloprotease [Aestuariibacter halophilus]
MDSEKLRRLLIFSSNKAYVLFSIYLITLYFLYLNTDYLSSEVTSSKNVLNQYGVWWSLIFIGLIGPLVEEFIFRYLLFKLLSALKMILVLTVSSALWAVLHYSGNLLVPIMLFVLGWILGVLRIQSDSILSPTIVHASNNVIFIFFLMLVI